MGSNKKQGQNQSLSTQDLVCSLENFSVFPGNLDIIGILTRSCFVGVDTVRLVYGAFVRFVFS
jgi:hypothetical protein